MSHEHSLEKEAPGTWYSMHLMSKRAIDIEKKKSCVDFINSVREEFFCSKCRNHFNEYCSVNPLPNIYNSGPKDFFYWSVNAHNNANMITNKPIMSIQNAEKLYYDSEGLCTSGCDEDTILPIKNNYPVPFSIAFRTPKSPIPKGFNNSINKF
jgi:hypothetical protein